MFIVLKTDRDSSDVYSSKLAHHLKNGEHVFLLVYSDVIQFDQRFPMDKIIINTKKIKSVMKYL